MTDTQSTNITWHEGLPRDKRWEGLGARGATLWFTGLSGSGKSTIACALEQALIRRDTWCYRLDGDNVRHGLNANLNFSADDRKENIRRVGEVSKLFADSGVLALSSFISPYRADRDAVRKLHEDAELLFLEVFVDTPLEVCEKRDPKGLYKKARAGEIKQFTGIDDPYERPHQPEIVLPTAELSIEQCVEKCIETLISSRLLD